MKVMETMKKILLVDDDEMQNYTTRQFLKSKYEVHTADSGEKAIELIRAGFRPDLIILDILMPNMDGWETFNKLKMTNLIDNVPIAFLTSLDRENFEKHANDIGAADFFTKPLKESYIIKRVEHILDSASNEKMIDYHIIN